MYNQKMIMYSEMERIGKETVVVYFKALSQHAPGQTGANHLKTSGWSISLSGFEPDTP
jgi:hypothetical protein